MGSTPSSKAECMRQISSLTTRYQTIQRNIASCQTNCITNPQWKAGYKAEIQKYKAEAASVKAEIAKYKAMMKTLK